MTIFALSTNRRPRQPPLSPRPCYGPGHKYNNKCLTSFTKVESKSLLLYCTSNHFLNSSISISFYFLFGLRLKIETTDREAKKPPQWSTNRFFCRTYKLLRSYLGRMKIKNSKPKSSVSRPFLVRGTLT